MDQAQTSGDVKRRKAKRRHRRERQIMVFGVIIIAVGAVAFAAAAIYRGEVEGPFSAEFNSPAPDLAEIDLVCPPSGALPLSTDQIVVRISNGTDTQGLAGSVEQTLEGRGFVTVGAVNWSRTYDDTVLILFGEQGVAHAYTLARQFEDAELVLDNREDITLDLVLGEEFAAAPALREPLAPELDTSLPLTADGECRPAGLVVAQPAPRTLPENPLAEASPEPSTEPEGDEG